MARTLTVVILLSNLVGCGATQEVNEPIVIPYTPAEIARRQTTFHDGNPVVRERMRPVFSDEADYEDWREVLEAPLHSACEYDGASEEDLNDPNFDPCASPPIINSGDPISRGDVERYLRHVGMTCNRSMIGRFDYSECTGYEKDSSGEWQHVIERVTRMDY